MISPHDLLGRLPIDVEIRIDSAIATAHETCRWPARVPIDMKHAKLATLLYGRRGWRIYYDAKCLVVAQPSFEEMTR